MAEKTKEPRFVQAVEILRPTVSLRAIQRAISVLDDLKASGLELGDELEASRKELRSSIGWSALAPVSLWEALAQQGVLLETQPEDVLEALVRAIDRGLVAGLGSRGEAYETALRSIAHAVAEDFGG